MRGQPGAPPRWGAHFDKNDPINSGLVGGWIMRLGSGLVIPDASVYGLDPATAAPITMDSTAKPRSNPWGLGVKFDGSTTFGTAPYFSRFNCTAGVTIAGRFLGHSGSGYAILIQKPFTTTNSDPYSDWHLIQHAQALNFRIGSSGTDSGDIGTVKAGYMHTALARANGVSWDVWLDGTKIYTNGSAATPSNTNSRPLQFGKNVDGGDQYDGEEAHWRVWNRGLADAEVERILGDPLAGLARYNPLRIYSFAVPDASLTITAALAPSALTLSAAVDPVIGATAALAPSALTMAAAIDPKIDVAMAAAPSALTLAANIDPKIDTTFAATLAALTLSASQDATVAATAAFAPDALTLAAAVDPVITFSADLSPSAFILAAAGDPLMAVAVAAAPSPLTLAANADPQIAVSCACVMGALTFSASDTLPTTVTSDDMFLSQPR